MYRQNGDLANLLKSARKKVPQSARLSAGGGGGGRSALGENPNPFGLFFLALKMEFVILLKLPQTPISRVEQQLKGTKLLTKAFGHCPNSDCTPPPHSNGHSGAHFSRADLSKFAKSPF